MVGHFGMVDITAARFAIFGAVSALAVFARPAAVGPDESFARKDEIVGGDKAPPAATEGDEYWARPAE